MVGLVVGCNIACAEGTAPVASSRGITIADFAYVDTSGEAADQEAAHRERLQAFTSALRRDFATDSRYRVVSISCRLNCMDEEPADLLRAAADAGAKIVVVGGVHKMSTLVQWAKIEAIDVEANSVVLDKLFTFRGDTDQAWEKAETFVFKEIISALATSTSTPEPAALTKLAMFDFELDDFSAGASPSGPTPADAVQLTNVTKTVRQLLAQSGRYRLIDVTAADAAAAREHTLRQCDGCDAAISLKLGAEQSFLGVVSRVSRTEYTVRFQIRDARTSAVLADGDSGLRMGADYSWGRGAARLVEDHLLQP